MCTLVLFCKVSNFSLQVQGDVLEVLEGLLQALNRVPGTSAMVINEDEAAGEGGDDGDDGDDPEGYPGLFSNNVSCLMLLWPLTMMLCVRTCVLILCRGLLYSSFQFERDLLIVTGSGVIGLVLVKTSSWFMQVLRVSFWLFLSSVALLSILI